MHSFVVVLVESFTSPLHEDGQDQKSQLVGSFADWASLDERVVVAVTVAESVGGGAFPGTQGRVAAAAA